MLQIRLLGQFDIRLDGKRVIIPTRTAQSLFAYLVLTAGTPHRREKLAGTFWPDTTDENARKNLRQELWRIRKAFSAQQFSTDEYLNAEELTIAFNRSAPYWLDVSQLERPEIDLESLTANLALYQGELLPGFYEDWIMLERERIQGIFETKMDQLLKQLVAAEHWTAVQEQGERWLSLGHTLEPAYRAIMLAYGARGDMAKVSSTYQRCIEELREQFGLEPSAETRALYDGLLKGTHAPVRSAGVQTSGTVTFLFTDIEESTNLLDKLGNQYATVLADHHAILRAAIKKWNGHEVDTQGDAFFVTFARAMDAIQCAAEAQRALDSHPWMHGKPLRVRMGLHTGEPLIASTGYVGMDVHRAARIGDAAHGGQVLLSQTTRGLVVNDLPKDLSIRDLGEHRLKDLKFPTPIYQLIVPGLSPDFPPIRTKFTGSEAPIAGEAPFKGLQYFEEIDSELFFGREILTAKLVKRLGESQFLSVIIGASGSGKSSLVRAGLIPSLKKGQTLMDGTKPPEGSTEWRVHIITPTAHPLEALAIELTRDSESVTATSTLMDDLMQDPRSLALFLIRKYPKGHTLLVLDQFEELFTLCRDEFEREAFIDNLLTTLNQGERHVTLVLTLRADFYAHLAQYPELRDAVAKQQEYIGPMTTEELRRAIEEPAQRGHWAFEPGLVDLILRDVGDEPGALPLLSHALLETWKRRAGHTLTLKGYADAGGVHGAIAHTAESMYQNLSSAEQTITYNIFLRLTELGEGTEDTRRRTSLAELISHTEDADEVQAVLNRLAEARLITLGEDTVEVAHEALIREWPTLREWLTQDREGLLLHRQITEAAHEWELLERDAGSVYRGARLAQAREWAILHPNSLNARERAFIEASNELEQHEQAEREAQIQRELESARHLAETKSQSEMRLRIRNRVITTVGTIAIILAMLAGLFGVQSNQNASAAQSNAATAQIAKDNALNSQATAQAASTQAIADFNRSEAQRLAAEANSLRLSDGDPNLIALLSIRSLNMKYTSSGDEVLTSLNSLQAPPRVFKGHTDEIWDMAISPDGKYLVTSSKDKTARLWDFATGETIRIFSEHTDIVSGIAFSSDGKYVVTGSYDHTARLWDVATGQTLQVFTGQIAIEFIAISPDGRNIVTTSHGEVRVWDVATGKTVHIFIEDAKHTFLGVDYSPDGKHILVASDDKDNEVRLWDAVTWEQVRVFNYGTPIGVQAVAFSPDGKTIATGEDNIVVLWDVATGQSISKLSGFRDFINDIKFSPDGKFLLAGGGDTTPRLWDVATGKTVRVFGGIRSVVQQVAFTSDGKFVVTVGNDKVVQVWSLQTSPGGMVFAGHSKAVRKASFSPDGKRVVTASDDFTARIWDSASGQTLMILRGHTKAVTDAVFSPDGKMVLTASADKTARLWDVATGKELRRFEGHTDELTKAVFSPDGKTIVTTSYDDTARVWATQTGKTIVIYTNQGPGDLIRAAFSPDGKTVATTGADHTARIWDPLTGKDLMIFKGHTDNVTGVAFSPDDKSLLTASFDGTVRLWDIASGKEIRQFIGHTGNVYGAAFSPDGNYVLTSGVDLTARLWDVQTGQELRRFAGHTDEVRYVAFSPDGKHILTASQDGTARLWLTDLDDTIRAVCSLLTRDMTLDERTQFGISDQKPTCPAQ
jgi:WD40 repeat protein/class 3 adenylate cyclase